MLKSTSIQQRAALIRKYRAPDAKPVAATNIVGTDGAFLLAFVLSLVALGQLSAQEAIRPSIAGAESAVSRMHIQTEDRYNLKLGPVAVNFSAGASFEYNTNINLAQTGALSDFIISPHIEASAIWHATALNTLSLNIGLGFDKYLDHPAYDTQQILISPGNASSISFDVYVADTVKINFHDFFSISQDPTNQPTLSNVVNFTRFENTAGTTVVWDLNQLILTFGYDHYDYISLSSAYDYLNHGSELLNFSAAWLLNPTTTVGLDINSSYVHYTQNATSNGLPDQMNDGVPISVGPFLEMAISNYLRLRVSGGFQGLYFSTGSNYTGNLNNPSSVQGTGGTYGDNSSTSNWYGDVSLAHRLNSYCTETLSFGHENALGLSNNFNEINYVRYTNSYKIFKNVTTDFNAFFENVDESGPTSNPGVSAPTYTPAENLNRYGVGIHAGYLMGKSTTIGAGYQFIYKQSNQPNDSYHQSRVYMDINHQF